ncbi:Hpt domain-containing protein [Qipengyuania sediminis]|uniref:Hpt domain-containing protein n=1 Tax=Qipengyuania sediminis TaxID=1532023 RepID=UPI00105A81FB|nr:Hpt domain-containing protein [Qipengyuania sediminis]
MAYESGTIETALAAAAGEDLALFAELRLAFLESASRQLDLMRRSRCDANWRMAAQRLQGIAASFHDDALAGLAREAERGAPGDPAALRVIGSRLDVIGGQAAP